MDSFEIPKSLEKMVSLSELKEMAKPILEKERLQEKANRDQFFRELAGCFNRQGRHEGDQWCSGCRLATCINYKGAKQ